MPEPVSDFDMARLSNRGDDLVDRLVAEVRAHRALLAAVTPLGVVEDPGGVLRVLPEIPEGSVVVLDSAAAPEPEVMEEMAAILRRVAGHDRVVVLFVEGGARLLGPGEVAPEQFERLLALAER